MRPMFSVGLFTEPQKEAVVDSEKKSQGLISIINVLEVIIYKCSRFANIAKLSITILRKKS